ncbi:recombinase family protein, partial [Candidatus Dojkabacteria bacterium]|nr:recombinase family protein [Candidatus Dojkabacteria bacterium]
MSEVAKELNLNIVNVLSESGSGFHTGRPVFNEMVEMILRGEADGIITWKLSRLSRNPDDAGKIMGMLQREEIRHIRTSDRHWFPEDNVVMMYVEFGMHNQYSRDLSVDLRRGLNQKASRGWFPNASVPIGYMHSPFKQLGDVEIINDKDRFDLMQFALKAVASGKLLPMEAFEEVKARGLKSRRGGNLSKSAWYSALTNTFYYGEFEYPKNSGIIHKGKHTPMISEAEFNHTQEILGRKGKPRPKKHFFSYTGLIKCSECGCSIIADPKTKIQQNGNIHHYIYYRCSKKRGNCSQKALEIKQFEKQVSDLLSRITLPQDFHEWAINELKNDQMREIEDRNNTLNSARNRYDEVSSKIDKLVEGWIEGKIPETVYKRKLEESQKEQDTLKQILDNVDDRIKERVILVDNVLNFAGKARDEFINGDEFKKREIFSRLGSNFLLK